MTARISTVFFTITLLLTGCTHRAPQATVEVIDTSMSITPRAEHAALDALGSQISHLGRGDRLILIPITGDAENDAGGRILRLSAPTVRESYDTDLRRFQVEAKKQFAAWVTSLNQHQTRTDILGTLDVARQELAALPNATDRRLIIVSDFLEDEPTYRFVSASRLTSSRSARTLATDLRAQRHFAIPGVPICLGQLESSDLATLSEQRKDAVRAFWSEYLSDKDHLPELHFDGTGMLVSGATCFPGSQSATSN